MFIIIYFLVYSFLFPLILNQNCPNGIYGRKEFRDLSDREWTSFKTALRSLLFSGRYAQYSITHMAYFNDAHGTPAFLPWHRFFIRQFEEDLQAIDPSISLPYWDWTVDAWNPIGSGIFTDYYLGIDDSNGDNWPMTVPDSHELVRGYDPANFGSFYDGAAIESIIASNSVYDSFRIALEGAPHGIVHANIGGDMALMYSPNDPIFYLHHAFVDKIWTDWQSRNNMMDYAESLDTIMQPFGQPVGSVMDPTTLCYSYQPFSQRMTADGLEIVAPPPTINGPLHLPPPLPVNWITMHGISEQYIRDEEHNLTIIMAAEANITITSS